MDTSIYMRMLLCERVKLEPAFISKQYKDELLRRLKEKVEGICSRHGYIKKNSVELYKVCVGRVEMIGLNGNTQYDVHFYADVCNPLLGSTIVCRVTNINKFGILAEADDVIEAIIAKNSVNIHSEVNLEKIRIGDDVLVEVVAKKYELNDKKISVIGKIVKSSHAATTLSTAYSLKNDDVDDVDGEANQEEFVSLLGGDGNSDEDDDKSDSEEEEEENVEEDDNDDKDDGELIEEESDIDESEDDKNIVTGGGFFSDEEDYFNSGDEEFEGGDSGSESEDFSDDE